MLNHYLFLLAVRAKQGLAALRWPRLLLGACGMLLALMAHAQQGPAASFFTDDAAARRAAATAPLTAALTASRALTLDEAGLRAALAAAPLESKGSAAKPLVLTLPLPDGTNARFAVREAPVMAPKLAAQFPAIKTYVGVGLDDAQATVRLDFTPRGFHAQVLSAKTGTFFIDPTVKADTKHYLSFWKRDMPGRSFDCEVLDSDGAGRRDAAPAGAGLRTSGPVLRTYRLAMAATAEYTAYQGGTVALGVAAIVTSVNRVVGVYEKELAVRFILVDDTALMVYTDPDNDPFDNKNANNALLAQNQTNTDAIIGTANYDIGHVFSTTDGGVAGLGVVCRAGQKARGTTGLPEPVGDAFDIDFVAHEIGHQCGGNHTFNGDAGNCAGGNRNAATAYEPGSGTTIMAYAGICGAANNLQPNSDPYFHIASYEQIQAYLGTTSCAVTTATGNAPPLITLPASGRVLPIGTPFKLTANAFDPDNDALSYCWEEYDLGAQGSPTAAQVANVNVPIFRSFNPTANPTRYFPRLTSLVNNTTVLGERLPTVSRALRFRVTVRDQNNGSQGIIGGVNSSPIVTLSSTSAAGPFLVTAPDATGVSWAGGSSQAITWDVAGTTANGVDCATVNIRLSTDGGLTYPTLLLSGTANDGTEAVTLPNLATTTARIMVEAADNYFFDISNNNFAITTTNLACAAPTAPVLGSITRTSASLSFTASGAASYTIRTEPATTTQTVTSPAASLTGLVPGTNYTVYIQADCGADGLSSATAATFSTLAPPVCNPATNLQVTTTTTASATVTFTASTSGPADYTVTTSPATTTQTITASPITLTGLNPGTTYTVSIRSNCTSAGLTGLETITFTTRPLNDECAAAVAIAPGAACTTTAGSVLGATESRPAGSCSGAVSSVANDVWYKFVAGSGPYGVTATSGFDGVLEIFGGSCGNLSSLGCADAAGTDGSEQVALPSLTAGNTYYVRYFAYNGAVGDGTFTLCVQSLTNLIVSTPQAVGGAYYNVTVTGTGIATLNNDLTVFGTMNVQNGGALTSSLSYYVQGPGSFALAAGATLTETNTAGITNTGAGGFLFSNTTPSFSADANYVFAGASAQLTGPLLPTGVRNLTVNNGAFLQLANPVSVTQVLRLQSGNLVLNGRRLLLRSVPTGTALVDNTGGVVTGATAAMQRALTGGVTGYAYRHYSSPVATLPLDSLRTAGTVPIVNAAYNTSATPGRSTPFPTVFGYDESRIATVASTYGDFDKGWFSPASLGEAMQRTKGYTVNAPATGTPVRFTGTLNTGTQNSGALTRGTSTDAGWQLLGNPYPSPLDWSTVAAAQRPGMDAAMYVFQSTSQYTGIYRSFVNGVGGTASQIEAGSGYFVRVTAAGTAGAVNLTNANRVTTFGSQNAFGRTAADVRPQLQLRVAGADLSDDAYLYVEAGATTGVDAEYDAVKLPNSTGLNLASLAGATPLAIQGLPTLAGTTETVLPLTLNAPAAGSFAFEVADLSNFGATTVYLRDAATGTQQVLAAGTRYSFTLASATAGAERFALVLRPAAPLATPGPVAPTQVTVSPNPARVSFTVEMPTVPGASQVDAELLNTLGQVVRRQSAALPTSGARFAVPTAGLAAGVYVLRLQAGTTTITKRVVIE